MRIAGNIIIRRVIENVPLVISTMKIDASNTMIPNANNPPINFIKNIKKLDNLFKILSRKNIYLVIFQKVRILE